jgi:2-polyprenyl-3-methyl-5-hydroxy-6-metoxy-1,4-benzoquinol methylase
MICDHKNRKVACSIDNIPLFQCIACGIIFNGSPVSTLDPKDLYKTYYKNELGGRFTKGVEYVVRAFRFFRAFKIFTISPRAKRILDIGSGRGFTLYYLKKFYKYTRTAGTQISKNAYEFSRNRLGLEIYDKDLLELSLEEGDFDVITLWHVLEHVPAPEQYIGRIRSLLAHSGKLVIEVPNFNSWTRAITGKYWLGLDLEYHINFFTPESLSGLLKNMVLPSELFVLFHWSTQYLYRPKVLLA